MLKNIIGFLTSSSIVVPGENGELEPFESLADYTLSEEYANALLQATKPPALVIGLCALLALVCIALVIIILMQKKRASGIGAALSGTGETYWSKNKGKSVEGSLERYTKWGATLFMIIALVINIVI